MKSKLILFGLILVLMAAGCGVNKDYVSQQISESEARADTKIGSVQAKADANASGLQKLQGLAVELEKKADMALNEAKGFENYQIIWEAEINFDYDSYDVDDVAGQILNEAGAKMGANPSSLIEIVGHTDASGSSKYNLLLGEKRAGSSKR